MLKAAGTAPGSKALRSMSRRYGQADPRAYAATWYDVAMNNTNEDKWYRGGLHFECTQCGNCCTGDPGYVWVTKEEIRRISAFLGRRDGWLDEEHLRRVGLRYSLVEESCGDCVFLRRSDKGTKCSIHPVRPLQCRTWPFWNQNLSSVDAWNEAHKKCPGTNRGKHVDFIQIEVLRTQRSW